MSCLILHVRVHGYDCDHMTTTFEVGIFHIGGIIFKSIDEESRAKDFKFGIANATLWRAYFATKSHACMTTRQQFAAGLIARVTIADIRTSFGAFQVFTVPFTSLHARIALYVAFVSARTMKAGERAVLFARRAWSITIRAACVGTG